MEPVALSISAAARVLGIGRTTTYQLINSNQLETIRIGRRQLVTTASIRKLADGGGTVVAPEVHDANGEHHG